MRLAADQDRAGATFAERAEPADEPEDARASRGIMPAMAPRRRRLAPIVAFSGPSGSGKTRLLARLIPALARRGLRVGALKHSGHPHGLDRRGKDSERLVRAGATAVVVEGPSALAYFGPPAGGPRAMARLLPPVDVVVAEGFKSEGLWRVELHRKTLGGEFLCARDRRVVAVVTDEPPPRQVPTFGPGDVEPLADFLCRRFRLGRAARPRARRRRRPGRGPGPSST